MISTAARTCSLQRPSRADISKVQAARPYEQPVQLFWNTGVKPTFGPDQRTGSRPDLFRPQVAEAAPSRDIDGDGFSTSCLPPTAGRRACSAITAAPATTGFAWCWKGTASTPIAAPSAPRVVAASRRRTQNLQVSSARGYLSQSELPLTFGLGKATKVDRITVHWPRQRPPHRRPDRSGDY